MVTIIVAVLILAFLVVELSCYHVMYKIKGPWHGKYRAILPGQSIYDYYKYKKEIKEKEK
jgi:hypothetical protein